MIQDALHPTVPAGDADADVGSVVAVGIVMHTNWVGSGLHVRLSTHTELGDDGANPDC